MSQPESPTFLAIGDLHTGRIPMERLAAVFTAARRHPRALFLASPGDITDAGLPEQYDTLHTFTAALPYPFLPVMGNHDALNGTDAETQARFRDRIGVKTVCYTREFAGVPFLFLSTDGNINGCEVQIEKSLPLLEAMLCEGSGPLFILCHAPLTGTVGCLPGRSCFLSTDADFGLPQTGEVRAMVRASGRPVVWISGHVHAPLGAENLFHTERLGDATLHSVSLSCPYFTGRDFRQDEPVAMFSFALQPGGAAVRVEDASTGAALREEWLAFGGPAT